MTIRRRSCISNVDTQDNVMKTKIRKWGNSLAVRIPKSLADEMALDEGSQVDLSLNDNGLVIRSTVTRHDLRQLVKQISKSNRHDEIDPGESIGREEW